MSYGENWLLRTTLGVQGFHDLRSDWDSQVSVFENAAQSWSVTDLLKKPPIPELVCWVGLDQQKYRPQSRYWMFSRPVSSDRHEEHDGPATRSFDMAVSEPVKSTSASRNYEQARLDAFTSNNVLFHRVHYIICCFYPEHVLW